MRPLTVALPKGRLAKQTLTLLQQAGLPYVTEDELKTRKLILQDEEQTTRFFLAKGPDVPVYVEYGVADLGIVGKDFLLEEERSVYEVLDLGIGRCRMCVCGPPEAATYLQHTEQIRVATKYPNIARKHFYQTRNQTVELIKLHGSIELAPMVALAEVIVDIVETGDTLRENGLVILEEICPLSAQLIVNPVSMRMDSAQINAWIRSLRQNSQEGNV